VRATRRTLAPLAMAGLLAAGLACDDLLQEPDTGIAAPLLLEVAGGNDQIGDPGSALPEPLRVRLSSNRGGSVERLRVEWVVVTGGGRVTPRNTFTDAGGFSEATWTLGPASGSQIVEARVGDSRLLFAANRR
jgi:hypothetical protein